jgi:hypothetical protein
MKFLPRAIIRSQSGYVAGALSAFTDNFAGAVLNAQKWRQMFSHTVTISTGIAVDCVVTDTAHGLVANQPFELFSTGAPPTPISQIDTYYVSATGLTANTFKFSTAPGGAVFQTDSAGAGSGVNTARSVGYLGTGLKAFSLNNKLIETSDGAAATNYGGIESKAFYNLTGQGVFLKLHNTTLSLNHQQILSLIKDKQSRLDIYNDGSNGIRAVTTIAGSQAVQGTFAWPAAATWVRIREAGGFIFWDTAPDSSLNPGAWTQRATMANPFAVTAMQVQIMAGHFIASEADDIQNFGGFNTTALS